MSIVDWVRADYRPLVVFFLHIGVASFAYTWIVLTAATMIGTLIGTLLTVTVGHGLLIAALSVINGEAALREPDSWLLYLILSALTFWILTAPQLFEDYAPSASRDQPHSQLLLYARFFLLLLWIMLLCANMIPTHPWIAMLLGQAEALPWMLGEAIGLAGAYALLRSLFKAIFATAGIVEFLVKP